MGGGGSWSKHSVKKSQVINRNKYLMGLAPQLWDYVCEQIEIAVQIVPSRRMGSDGKING